MRHRRSQPIGLALFPFLSVLLCAIGTMVVVFAGTVLTSLDATRQTFVVSIGEIEARRPGQAWRRQPVYVLCADGGLTVFYSSQRVARLPAAALQGAGGERRLGELADSLDRLRAQRWPVLFVKPSGVQAMERLYPRLRRRGIPVGRWAFSEGSTLVVEATAPGGAP